MPLPFQALVFSHSRKARNYIIQRLCSSNTNIPQYETLAVSVPKKYVFHVELNRPKKLNTFNRSMWRYCTEDAWFQVKEVEVGLAADVGTLQRFPKVVNNTSIVRELCYTGRRFDATEALHFGLVSKLFPDKQTALNHVLDVAVDIAGKSPVAVQTTKHSLVYSQSRPNDQGLEHIRLLYSVMNQGDDLQKAAIAQATKAPPPDFDNL